MWIDFQNSKIILNWQQISDSLSSTLSWVEESVLNILDSNYLNSKNFINWKRLLKEKLQSWNTMWIDSLLTEILTSRPEFLEEKYWKEDPDFLLNLQQRVKAQSDYYKKVISQVEIQCKKDGVLEVADNPAWFSLKSKNYSNNSTWLNYKLYLTIPINWYDYVSKIYQLWLMLNKLAENTWDKISLKLPSSMLWFLSHSDSLVVHFKNINNKESIEKILNEWKIKNWIIEETRNLWRTTFAWDSKNNSFTGLISDNINNWILENYWKYDNELLASLAIEYAIKQSQVPPKMN